MKYLAYADMVLEIAIKIVQFVILVCDAPLPMLG